MYIIKQNYEDQISMTKMVMKPLKQHLHKYLTKHLLKKYPKLSYKFCGANINLKLMAPVFQNTLTFNQ